MTTGFHAHYTKSNMENKKGQLKIQEMAFVLLALALLAMIAFIFFMRLQASSLERAGEETRQATAVSLLGKIAALQELRCEKGEICIDEDKVTAAKTKNIANLFQGLKKVEVKRIYPDGPNLIIWQSAQGNQSYSTFINLCKSEKVGTSVEFVCGIGLLEAWV
jgi:hypothetical protein